MRQILRSVASLFLLSTIVVLPGRGQKERPRVFRSAEVLSASDVGIPYNSVANGMVELYVTIGADGKVADIQVARPLASVTEEAIRAVKSWTFSAATMRGKPIVSSLTICVVFCPVPLTTPSLALVPVEGEPHQETTAAALPSKLPEVIAAAYPPDGVGRVNSGTVVLRVFVEANGHPSLVRAIRDIPPMTAEALLAVKDWKFKPAQLSGKDVASGIVLAFAFRLPISNSY